MATTTNVLSLCSGAGGLDLAIRLALPGARTICYVENEVTACQTLAARMDDGSLHDAPVWTNLKTFDGRPWRDVVDLVIGGYPCQPFSVSGKQRGAADPRHLWPTIAKLLGVMRPKFCFFENVSGHLRLGYSDVRAQLRAMDYRVAAGLFTAEEVGAPHKRERLFIFAMEDSDSAFEALWHQLQHAWPSAIGRAGSDVAYAAGNQWRHDQRDGHRMEGQYGLSQGTEGSGHAGYRSGQLADAEGIGQREPDHARCAVARQDTRTNAGGGCWLMDAGRELGDADGERREGAGLYLPEWRPNEAVPSAFWSSASVGLFPPGPGELDEWRRVLSIDASLAPAVVEEAKPKVRRAPHGYAGRLDRLRQIGNGVVPLVAAKAYHVLGRELLN